ncbi:hypothetical protein HBB16_15515 [Pseudonocardia sp. MCCB 268]|nr:hypothetical protein [Pseudonocardia cytotoxica]
MPETLWAGTVADTIAHGAWRRPVVRGESRHDRPERGAAGRPVASLAVHHESTYRATCRWNGPRHYCPTPTPRQVLRPRTGAGPRHRLSRGRVRLRRRPPGACVVVGWPAARSSSPATGTGGCARSTTSAGTAPQLLRRGRARGRPAQPASVPVHSWTYDTDGRCLGTAVRSPTCRRVRSRVPTRPSPRTSTAPTTACSTSRSTPGGFFLFVNLDPDPAPLTDHLGDLPQRFAGHRRRGLDTAPPPHLRGRRQLPQARRRELRMEYPTTCRGCIEELNQVSRFSDHYRWQRTRDVHRHVHHAGVHNTGAGGWDGLAHEHARPGGRRRRRVQYGCSPSTAGRAAQPRSCCSTARSPRTAQSGPPSLLTHPESLDDPRAEQGLDQLEAFWDLVNRQDLEIVEQVQGVENRLPGWPDVLPVRAAAGSRTWSSTGWSQWTTGGGLEAL